MDGMCWQASLEGAVESGVEREMGYMMCTYRQSERQPDGDPQWRQRANHSNGPGDGERNRRRPAHELRYRRRRHHPADACRAAVAPPSQRPSRVNG